MVRRFLGALLVLAGMILPALAQETCIQCDGPSALYRCVIQDSDKAGQFKGRGKAVEFLCVTELARLGRHERCRAARDFGNVCLGDQRILSWSGARDGEGEVVGAGPADVEKRPTAGNEPPRTLVEAARNTVEQSKTVAKKTGESIEQAGEAVGGAVKKTWTCLVTLFSSC